MYLILAPNKQKYPDMFQLKARKSFNSTPNCTSNPLATVLSSETLLGTALSLIYRTDESRHPKIRAISSCFYYYFLLMPFDKCLFLPFM